MKTKFESKHGIGALVEFLDSKSSKVMGFITEITFTESDYCYAIECCNTKELLRGVVPSQVSKVYSSRLERTYEDVQAAN